ncbi:hypothetical protein B9G55_02270 [Saccharibacillus sp. O16]|nr:hypothetical protein B9G55_02270 [Saccharibacillus sp. O16]
MRRGEVWKRELLTIKWLPILLFLLIWSWRERGRFIQEVKTDPSAAAYNGWDIVFVQFMNPFLLLWLLIPLWLLLSLRFVMEAGEPTVKIRTGSDVRWLLWLLRRSCLPMLLLLGIWLLAMFSTLVGVPLKQGWSDFARSDHPFNVFAVSFVKEGWPPGLAVLAQLALLVLFLLMSTLILAFLRLCTERSILLSLCAAGLMISCIVAFHRQGHYPQWQWASIVNSLMLNNAYGTFGRFWPAFIGAPTLAAVCFGLALSRQNLRRRTQGRTSSIQGENIL